MQTSSMVLFVSSELVSQRRSWYKITNVTWRV